MARDIIAEMSMKQKGNRKPIDILQDIKMKQMSQASQDDQFQQENPFLYKAGEFLTRHPNIAKGVEAINTIGGPFASAVEASGLPQFAGGALEGAGNTAISIGNLPLQAVGSIAGKDLRVPHLDFSKYMNEGPGIAYGAGKILGPLATGAGAIGKTRELVRPQGYLGILSDIIKGAGAGYATGETAEGERGIGAVLGGLFGGITGSLPKNIGKRIEKNKKELQKEFGGLYENLFKEASDSGISRINKPTLKFDKILKNTPSSEHQSLLEFKSNPTLENAHRAQSDLGRIIRKFQSDYNSPGGLPSSQIKAWDAAKDAQKRIRGSMFDSFQKNNRPDLAEEYGQITKEYAEDYIPYTTKETKSLLKKLLGNEKHKKFIQENYPELQANETAKKVGKYGLYGLGLGSGSYAGKEIYNKLIGK